MRAVRSAISMRLGRERSGDMADGTRTSKTEWEISQLVKTRLFPDEGDERHPQAVLRSALRALFHA
jgi:hypothetical protein